VPSRVLHRPMQPGTLPKIHRACPSLAAGKGLRPEAIVCLCSQDVLGRAMSDDDQHWPSQSPAGSEIASGEHPAEQTAQGFC
jgi:hypothetical protein